MSLMCFPMESTSDVQGSGSKCRKVLDFHATESPPWREGRSLPQVSEMLNEIVGFRKDWFEMKEKYAKKDIDKVLDEMRTSFIHHVNVGEGIGTQTLKETRAVLSDQTSTRSLKRSVSKNETETMNIRVAMDHMADLLKQETDHHVYLGLLEQTEFIKEVHKKLMWGVNQCSTAPGHYSVNQRSAEYKGKVHDYPEFKSEEEAEQRVQILIDIYNDIIEDVKSITREHEKIELGFKCAAWFFFEFISLHPFGDGNGRLSRLLCSYILSVITPFPTSIYNIFCESKKTDYIDAIVSARTSKSRHPCDIAAMIIECNWSGWNYFIAELKKF